MIWHVLEVWLLTTVMFVAGCVFGAWLYGILAESRLATAQGVLADSVGDVLDRVKARLGLGPAWRPVHLRNIERPLPAQVDSYRDDRREDADDGPVGERSAYPTGRGGPREQMRALLMSAGARLRARDFGERRAADTLNRAASAPLFGADVIVAPKRPAGLGAPRGGIPDNLQRIKGIGKRNETLINKLGIHHFGQIAAWTPGEMRWIGQYLGFPERIERDDWVGQAIVLAMGTETGFEKSAERRRRRRHGEREFEARMAIATQAEPVADGVATGPGDGPVEPDDAGEQPAGTAVEPEAGSADPEAGDEPGKPR